MPSNNKITAIYCRLSKEDIKKRDESNSIKNQKILLEQHAKKLGLNNIRFFIDDGISGVFADSRPAFMELLELIQEDCVYTLLVKDLSRFYRNYHEAGELTETILPYFCVRLIALGDGIDQPNTKSSRKQRGGLDFMIAMKNLMNEVYVQDISQKRRLANVAKSSMGYPIGKPPYGYKYNDEKSNKKWAVDKQASRIVQYIFKLRLEENLSSNAISDRLCEERVKTPGHYAFEKGYRRTAPKVISEFNWRSSTVLDILKNRSYVGDIINFKTYTLSYKDKTKYRNSEEDLEIHQNVHVPIISREDFDKVQKSFERNVRQASNIPKSVLSGYLYCSDCGSKMNFRQDKVRPHNNSFICGNNRRNKRYCAKTHQVPVNYITHIITDNISSLVRYADAFEDNFIKILLDRYSAKHHEELVLLEEDIKVHKIRKKELEILFKRMYEDKTKGLITEEQFILLNTDFAKEQNQLNDKIEAVSKKISKHSKKKLNTKKLIQMLRTFTKVNVLTHEIMEIFVDKIVVHHRIEGIKERNQKIDIYYNFLGHIDIPKLTRSDMNKYQKSFSRDRTIQDAVMITA